MKVYTWDKEKGTCEEYFYSMPSIVGYKWDILNCKLELLWDNSEQSNIVNVYNLEFAEDSMITLH